jgi:hypothetical protein
MNVFATAYNHINEFIAQLNVVNRRENLLM